MIDASVEVRSYETPLGNTVLAESRAGTTDHDSILSCLVEDEYGLAERSWSGTALDIGAHVGGVTLLLLADNPDLRVVAVEALPDNADVIRRNLARNGFADRGVVINGAADCGTAPVLVAYGASRSKFQKLHRFIGGAVWQDEGPKGPRVTVPPVSLTSLVEEYGPISLVKIDCEGCEWSFLLDPAVRNVEEFRGEYHPRRENGPSRIIELLDPTHRVEIDETLDFGPFRAVRR